MDASVPAPRMVPYDPITGIPSEFNEYLPPNSEEYKRWKAVQETVPAPPPAERSQAPEGQLENLTIKDQPEQPPPKKKSGKKKHDKPEIVLENSTRSKKKSVTTISGLDDFGVKLAEASKLFGKKFASGASITKNPLDKDQIEVQGDFLEKAADLIVKQYKDKGIVKKDIYMIDNKKKVPFYDEEDGEDA
eukprot:jgi/Botrbrau1/12957/Bobra.154_2s0017.1